MFKYGVVFCGYSARYWVGTAPTLLRGFIYEEKSTFLLSRNRDDSRRCYGCRRDNRNGACACVGVGLVSVCCGGCFAVGYRVKGELREDNDKTQREVAEYLGTPYQYYSVYERGGSEISFERAIALAKYYNVSLDYIAGLTDVKTNSSVNQPAPKMQVLIGELERLSAEERETVVGFLRLLLKTLK